MKTMYKTKDFHTAAFMLACGEVKFHGVEPHESDPKALAFVFSPKKLCERLELDFIGGTAMVNARTYANAMRQAKDAIYAKERINH